MAIISVERLINNKENNKIVTDLILKDTSGKCFSNKDIEGNIIPVKDIANIYLEYTKMYGIKYDDRCVGLLSLTNDNEVSIFIEPDYQRMGIGRQSQVIFERILREEYKLDSLVAEATPDNTASLKLLNIMGYKKTGESREVPINDNNVLVEKYVKKL